MVRLSLVLLVLFCSAQASAQSGERSLAVKVSHTGDDSVGEHFAYQVREQLRRSAGLRLDDGAVYSLAIVTIDSDSDSRGNSTTYSVAYLASWPDYVIGPAAKDRLIAMNVGYCGSDLVESCAQDIVANADIKFSDFRRNVSSYIESHPEEE